ncbi:P-loop NTPase family protein [Psychroserpens luteus]|uniref:DNA replication protein DnaC n=1 Tax=Psychroserpens luteus TaxID=1434066 RepID=A0ABW5ZTR7_9FLAO|nr:hypothetical protein [Psychroserpens luteus]
MRNNDVQRTNQLINQFKTNFSSQITEKTLKPRGDLSKQSLWNYFVDVFQKTHGKKFVNDINSLNNLKILFHYFLRDEAFFECDNLRKDISTPSFDKGLLIIGGYGLGKTDYFKVFESIFKNYPDLRFKFYTSKELVHKYEICEKPMDKQCFFKDVERKLMFIDDISSERTASNFGKVDVIDEVLIHRYDNKLRTFASCNYTSDDNCAQQTLVDLGIRYGSRMYDRFHEMFNIIEFKGKSYR